MIGVSGVQATRLYSLFLFIFILILLFIYYYKLLYQLIICCLSYQLICIIVTLIY